MHTGAETPPEVLTVSTMWHLQVYRADRTEWIRSLTSSKMVTTCVCVTFASFSHIWEGIPRGPECSCVERVGRGGFALFSGGGWKSSPQVQKVFFYPSQRAAGARRLVLSSDPHSEAKWWRCLYGEGGGGCGVAARSEVAALPVGERRCLARTEGRYGALQLCLSMSDWIRGGSKGAEGKNSGSQVLKHKICLSLALLFCLSPHSVAGPDAKQQQFVRFHSSPNP